MADVKISALPASTTPLAGTEVLPIVQSSTTKQVSVANLTAGRAISASSLTLTTPLSASDGGTGLTSLGTGVATALGNAVNGASGICVQDASGNLGLGVTPSAWSGVKALQVNNTSVVNFSSSNSIFGTNYYFDGTNFRYISTAASSYYQQSGAAHIWYSAASGSAGGTISFTQAMTLDASGRLGVGVTSLYGNIDVATSAGRIFFIGNSGANFIGSVNSANTAYVDLQLNGATNQFFTAGVERARIDSGGNLLVGTTSAISSSHSFASSYAGAIFGARNNNTTAGKYWTFGPDNTNSFRVFNQSVTGMYMSDGATAWTAYSDERLKDIIEPITNAITKVENIRTVIGKFKTDDDGTRRSFLIAQDVEQSLPEAVTENGGYLGVAYTDVVPLALAAIKELAALEQELRSKVTALEAANG